MKIRAVLCFAVVALSLGLTADRALAEVKLPSVLGSHMVLQRDLAVPIWGTAAPGEKVQVQFRDQTKTATAGSDGKWLVKLDALKAGGPDKLVVSGSNTLTLEDVLVGEVWVGSGQSNMQGNTAGYAKGDEVLAKLAAGAPYAKVRLATARGGWKEATEANVNAFSALLFAFGLRLQQDLDVPVGLMVGAVGGTPSGPWLSKDAFAADTALTKLVATPPGNIGGLFEAHIRPFIPHAIRGVLWDQGESGTAVPGVDQYTLMGGLIRGWRKDWGQDFPFLYIQKPSGGGCAWDPADPVTSKASKFAPLPAKVPDTKDGLYRDNHIQIRRHPQTALVVSSDLGSGVHPTNKSGYGARAARVALGLVYGRKLEIYGPLYDTHKVEGNRVRVAFTHVGQGLAFKHGDKLQGFAVAGTDKAFHWADAVIDGNTVLLSCDKVPTPAAVRYAWSNNHPWANLFNKDGLPAQAFRTDPGE